MKPLYLIYASFKTREDLKKKVRELIEQFSQTESQNLRVESIKILEKIKRLQTTNSSQTNTENINKNEPKNEQKNVFIISNVVKRLGSSSVNIEATNSTLSTVQESLNSNSQVGHTLLARINMGNFHNNSFIDASFL